MGIDAFTKVSRYHSDGSRFMSLLSTVKETLIAPFTGHPHDSIGLIPGPSQYAELASDVADSIQHAYRSCSMKVWREHLRELERLCRELSTGYPDKKTGAAYNKRLYYQLEETAAACHRQSDPGVFRGKFLREHGAFVDTQDISPAREPTDMDPTVVTPDQEKFYQEEIHVTAARSLSDLAERAYNSWLNKDQIY